MSLLGVKSRSSDSNTIMTVKFRVLHLGQAQVRDARARFKVVACGRRWGKTELGKSLLLESAVKRRMRGWWLVPTRQMASQVWRDLKTSVGNVAGVMINEGERRIDIPERGTIAVRSTHHPDSLRGEGLDLAILDEAAFMEARVWPEVVRPMLVSNRGGAVFLSTPRGRNWFWDLYRAGRDGEGSEWRSFHFSTADNPLIAVEELENIRRMTAARVWRSEYEASFSDESGQVFRRIREAVCHVRPEGPRAGHRYVAGVDWGRDYDYTVMVMMDATCRQIVAMDRFNQIGWHLQRGRLQAMVERWRPQAIWAEDNGIGGPNIEALIREGLPMRRFMTTAKSKAPLIESLALAIERGLVALLDDPVLLAELASYSLERLPGGGYRYGAPAGLHDDAVMAAALAWHAARHSGPLLDFV